MPFAQLGCHLLFHLCDIITFMLFCLHAMQKHFNTFSCSVDLRVHCTVTCKAVFEILIILGVTFAYPTDGQKDVGQFIISPIDFWMAK